MRLSTLRTCAGFTRRWYSSSDPVTRFTKEHEWIRYTPGNPEITLGITNYAQEALGDVVFVDLPSIGNEFKKDQVVAAVESVKAASDILMVCDGKITEINDTLQDDPSSVNSSAENKGWFLRFHVSNPADLEEYMLEEEYESMLAANKV